MKNEDISADKNTFFGIWEWNDKKPRPTFCYWSKGMGRFVRFEAKYFKAFSSIKTSDTATQINFYSEYDPHRKTGLCEHVIYFYTEHSGKYPTIKEYEIIHELLTNIFDLKEIPC